MKKFLLTAAAAMAGFMDFGVGTFLALLLGVAMHMHIDLWVLLGGAALALLPDFDIVVPIVLQRHRKIGAHHTSPFHWPMFVVPVVTLAAYVSGGMYWGTLAFICLIYHYIHDTPAFFGGNFGWFAPFRYSGVADKYMPWLEKYWLKPSYRAAFELLVGGVTLASALGFADYQSLAYWASWLALLGTFSVWGLARRYYY